MATLATVAGMVALAPRETNLGQLRSAFLDAVFHPGHHSIENLLLAPHVELIAGNDVNQLVCWQQHELFAFHDLPKSRVKQSASSLTTSRGQCILILYKSISKSN